MSPSDEPTMIQKTALIPQEDVDRFNELHPERGAYSWFARKTLSLYIRLFSETPDERLGEVVEKVAEDSARKEGNHED